MTGFQSFLVRKFRLSRPRSTPSPRERRALPDSLKPSSSGLFGRLPFEIRYMIYVYVLGGNDLHLNNEAALKMDYHSTFRQIWPIYHNYLHPYHLLYLLQTCRQIYVEAYPVLYSTNTFGVFGVDDLLIFPKFCRQIRRDRLEMITSIYITCQMDVWHGRHEIVFINYWRQTWDVLATQMLGLNDLEVRLVKSYFPPLNLALEEDWVKPMLGVRGLRRFEFDLAQGIGSDQSTAEYNENLERFQKELRTSVCSAK